MDVNSGSFEAVACKVEKNEKDTQINENLDNGQERDSDQEHPINMEEIKIEPDDTDNTEIPDQDMIIPGMTNIFLNYKIYDTEIRVSSKRKSSNKKAATKRKITTKIKKKRVVEIKTEKLSPIN
ncbi:Protein of unknown function [Cotesia congregata]|uniref:Uncharacterized protein n=1 Tax=Cotesia congregata TaxID=51543 RepID=A0A8J2H9X8_COTCN|nr:Protein of unknown function [Cotesia congregata]